MGRREICWAIRWSKRRFWACSCGAKVLVDEGDGHAAFADLGGEAFDGTGADVAGREDPGDAGFEEERLAPQGPKLRRSQQHVETRQHVAALVARDPRG